MRLKVWRWSEPVYDVAIYIVQAPFDAYVRWVRKTFNDPNYCLDIAHAPQARCAWNSEEQGSALIFWFSPMATGFSPHWSGIIAHEAVHGAQYVFRSRGLVVTAKSEEALTYYVAYLVREITSRLWKRRRR